MSLAVRYLGHPDFPDFLPYGLRDSGSMEPSPPVRELSDRWHETGVMQGGRASTGTECEFCKGARSHLAPNRRYERARGQKPVSCVLPDLQNSRLVLSPRLLAYRTRIRCHLPPRGLTQLASGAILRSHRPVSPSLPLSARINLPLLSMNATQLQFHSTFRRAALSVNAWLHTPQRRLINAGQRGFSDT